MVPTRMPQYRPIPFCSVAILVAKIIGDAASAYGPLYRARRLLADLVLQRGGKTVDGKRLFVLANAFAAAISLSFLRYRQRQELQHKLIQRLMLNSSLNPTTN